MPNTESEELEKGNRIKTAKKTWRIGGWTITWHGFRPTCWIRFGDKYYGFGKPNKEEQDG